MGLKKVNFNRLKVLQKIFIFIKGLQSCSKVIIEKFLLLFNMLTHLMQDFGRSDNVPLEKGFSSTKMTICGDY